jgi:hypothetical protein
MSREAEAETILRWAEGYQRFPEHHCIDHLQRKHNHVVETHGLDCGPYEEWDEEWDECAACHEQFDEVDVANLAKEADERARYESSEEEFCDYMEIGKTATEDRV